MCGSRRCLSTPDTRRPACRGTLFAAFGRAAKRHVTHHAHLPTAPRNCSIPRDSTSNSCALACRRCPSASRGDHAGTAVGLPSGASNATTPITQLIARRYRARRRSRANTSTTECMLERPVWINRACTQTGSPIRIGATNRTPLPCAVTQSPAPDQSTSSPCRRAPCH